MENFTELEAKAKAGDPVAQYELGEIYQTGDEVPVNLERAFKWYSLSAEQGFIAAVVCVTKMHAQGEELGLSGFSE